MRGKKGNEPPKRGTDNLIDTPASVADYVAANRGTVEYLYSVAEKNLDSEVIEETRRISVQAADQLRSLFSHVDDATLAGIATWVTVSTSRMAMQSDDPTMLVCSMSFASIAVEFYKTGDELHELGDAA